MNKRATFLSNRPLGKDLLDGQSQDYVALAIKKHIEEVDAKKDDENDHGDLVNPTCFFSCRRN